MRIARAIDVGYGNTKFTLNDGRGAADIDCTMFPSVAPVSKRRVEDYMDKRDTVVIDCGFGVQYEVGPDSMLGVTSNSSRTLDLEFPMKDSYMALVLGAMAYMNLDRIDHLVVGLPVSNMKAMATGLKQKLTGTHRLPPQTEAQLDVGYRTIEVGEVRVVPQPVGGMYDFGVRHSMMREIQEGNSLLLDPGYFTFDWVVTRGMKMIHERSNAANNAGMAAVLQSVADQLVEKVMKQTNKTVDLTEGVLEPMGRALRTGEDCVFNGREKN